MNYTLLIIGLIFLFNPEIILIDILPDAIGFFLLARALAPLVPLSPSAEEAAAGFRKLGWISLLKIALIFPVFSASDPGVRLLFVFSLAVLRLAFLIPAFSRLYDAVSYFAGRAEAGNAALRPRRGICLGGFAARYGLALLPELLYLYIDDSNIYDTAVYPLAAYYPAVLFLSFLLSLILSVIWLVLMLRGFARLRRNTAFNQSLAAEIAAVPHSRAETVRKSASPALLLLSLSFFALIAVNVDGIPVIPTPAAPALLLAAMLYFSRVTALPRRCLTLPIAATAAAAVQYGSILFFTSRWQERAAIYFDKVKTHFLLPTIGEIVSAVLTILCLIFCLYPTLKRFLNEHTGTYWEASYREHNAGVLKDRQRRSTLLLLGTVLACVVIVGNGVSYWLLYRIPWVRFIAAAAAVANAVLWRMLIVSTRQGMEEKYLERD